MIHLDLEEAEVNLILSALGQQPYVNVADVINNIITQARDRHADDNSHE